MSPKRRDSRNDRLEPIHDAALGYAAVVLSIVCFLLALSLVVMSVRFVVGISSANSPNTATTTTATAAGTRR